jgi:hypothetical protein
LKKFISISVIIVLLLGVSFTCNKCTPIPLTIKKEIVYQENIGDAENYYGNYCASCHGIQDERNETIHLEGYSSWSPDSKNSDGTFSYSSIAVDTFIPFISHFYLNQNNKSQLEWFEISTMKRISMTDDLEDCWCFIA